MEDYNKPKEENKINAFPGKSFSKEEGAPGFHIAGIGASAGGLEALKIFLNNLPADTGIAFVIIQHLSPRHESLLSELLEKETTMPVQQVENNVAVKPNHIYVIPPNVLMSIKEGHLILTPRENNSGIFLPVNYFFKNLGLNYKHKAIGILLSGTGSDGTLGFADIKAEGGITFAQNEAAAFGGMPESAIEAGVVDFILPVENIASEIKAILDHPYDRLSGEDSLPESQTSFKRILLLLLHKKNIDFSLYKQATINRRILRRMALKKNSNLEEYLHLLGEDERETDQLYQDLLINVTTFFRDPLLFHTFKTKMLPQLLKNRSSSEMLRVWIPACSTGEEAISFAITLFEYSAERNIDIPFQIFATDLNAQIIERARSGIYLPGNMENISQERLKTYFIKTNGHFQVIKAIRDACVFATHNLLTDPPFSKMDIISCQNVLIYFTSQAQKKILKVFNYALNPTGYLFLGKSESIGIASNLFSQKDKDPKVYSKKESFTSLEADFSFYPQVSPPRNTAESRTSNPKEIKEQDIERDIEKLLLLKYVQPSVLVNNNLEILRFHGPVSTFLQPAFGKATLDLLKMVREDLVFELKLLLNKVKRERIPLKKQGLQLIRKEYTEWLDLEIIPLRINSSDPYFLIIFQPDRLDRIPVNDSLKPREVSQDAKDHRIEMLERDLQEANANARTLSEEFEAGREELQSANEEVLSSNEELQSLNEELETSKEELQSSNEELTTINDEIQLRIQEIKDAFTFREAIVETLREPLLVLNNDLKVVSANRAFYQNYSQTKTDTEGFYLAQMGHGQWDIPGLKEHLQEIVADKVRFEDFEVAHTFPNLGERIFLLSATRMSFAEPDKNRILLVIQDITIRRKAEEDLRNTLHKNTLILDSISDIFISVDRAWNFSFINNRAEAFLGKEKKQLLGKNIWDSLADFMGTTLHTHLVSAMKSKAFSQFEFFDKQRQEWYHFRLFPSDSLLSIYASRITEQKVSQELIQQSKERYETFISESTEGIWRFELKEPVPIGQPQKLQVEEFYKTGYVAECNDIIAQMYGFKNAHEMTGINIGELLAKNERNEASLLKFIEAGYRLSDVEIIELINGEPEYFLINLVGIIEKDHIKRIWGTQRNITKQKLDQTTLERTREKLDFSLKAGSVGTFTWNIKSGKITASDILANLYGIELSAFKGDLKHWFQMIYDKDLPYVKSAIKECIHTAKELVLEFRIKLPDKTLRWILTRANLLLDNKGEAIEMSGISIDISERKFKEQIIKENEERFRALVQNAFEVITIFNAAGTITYQSDSIEKILGYSAKQRLGKSIYEESIVDPRDRDKEIQLIHKCIEAPHLTFQEELRMVTKEGEIKIMEVSCINLLENASIRGIIKNYRDVTERRMIEKQKEEFIGVASHELKTPVTSIKAYAQILQDIFTEKKDTQNAGLLQKMDRQIDRLTNLIKDLLDVTKITEGKLELKLAPFDLNDLINQVVEDMQPTTKKHKIIKNIDKTVIVLGDREKISQIFVNLLSNAIKYSPNSDEILIESTIKNGEISLCIKDYGIGISREIQKHLFNRFYRVIDESTKTFPGLGLGLYISAEIVKRHKGIIWVESSLGEGASFCFTLPIIEDNGNLLVIKEA